MLVPSIDELQKRDTRKLSVYENNFRPLLYHRCSVETLINDFQLHVKCVRTLKNGINETCMQKHTNLKTHVIH